MPSIDSVRNACVSYLPPICRSQDRRRLRERLFERKFFFVNHTRLIGIRRVLPTIKFDSGAGHLLVPLRQSQASVRHDPLYATLSVQ